MNLSDEQIPQYLAQAKELLRHAPPDAVFTPLCTWLRQLTPRYDWVGVYLLDGDELFLAAWDGRHATEHTTIPLAMGICGMAARDRKTINVRDVRQRPEYLACFLETQSEIVVPIIEGPTVLGEIDIDGTEKGAYDASDERFLERLARELAPYARRELTRPSGRA